MAETVKGPSWRWGMEGKDGVEAIAGLYVKPLADVTAVTPSPPRDMGVLPFVQSFIARRRGRAGYSPAGLSRTGSA